MTPITLESIKTEQTRLKGAMRERPVIGRVDLNKIVLEIKETT